MEKNMKNMKKKKKKNPKKAFGMLIGVLITYAILFFFYPDKIQVAFKYSTGLIINVLPVLLFVLVVMFLFNLIHEDKIKALITKSSKYMQYLIMVILGTISHGPIYAWYPLMKNLRDKGVTNGSIAAFLYARSIKLSFLPLAIYYFGFEYIAILTFFMFLFSYIQGIIIDSNFAHEKPL